MSNSGSAVAATNAVNTVEYVSVIKEGQVRNYSWDPVALTWVKQPVNTAIIISGTIHANVSGDWVNTSGNAVSVSGNAVTISGNHVDTSGNYFASGQSVVTSISGNHVDTSGNYFASGQSVVTSISGNHVDTSGNYFASGQVVTISGDWVNTSGNYFASGQSVVTSISGNWVSISGAYLASGQVVSISGNAVTMTLSYVTGSASAVGSGAVSLTYTNDATPRFFEYAEYHATSGAVLSGAPLKIQHISSDSGYSITMYSLTMETSATSDVFYQPDNPVILDSGGGIKITWANPDACAYYARIMTRR
jgi:hypothetical protein